MAQPPIFKPAPDKLKNAIAAILGRAIRTIKRFSTALHNKCNVVVYTDDKGRICSQFLKKDAFSGYSFEFKGGACAVTNKETGDVYIVSFGSRPHCNCPAFKYDRDKKPCKHIKMVAELNGNLKQVIAQEQLNEEKKAILIDLFEVPAGCRLERTDDWIALEYHVHAWGYQNIRGVRSLIQKNIGRIVQMPDGIYTYRLTSGIARTFETTRDAIAYLAQVVGTSFEEIAAAYDERMAFQKKVARL